RSAGRGIELCQSSLVGSRTGGVAARRRVFLAKGAGERDPAAFRCGPLEGCGIHRSGVRESRHRPCIERSSPHGARERVPFVYIRPSDRQIVVPCPQRFVLTRRASTNHPSDTPILKDEIMNVVKFGFGQAVPRLEDEALVRGKGRYVSDYAPPAL